MKQKVLITGVGGYIGTILTYTLLQNEYEVVGIDNFSAGYKEPLQLLQDEYGMDKFRYYKTDLNADLTEIFQKEEAIEVVLHLAGCCSVHESIANPQKYFTNNVSASQNLFTTMLRFNIHNVIFSSTCAVYGEKEKKVTENDKCEPTNPYGESKKMVEDMLRWYSRLLNMRYVALRYFNVCGASDDSRFGDSKKPSTHLVQNCVRAALGIEPLVLTSPKVDTPDGTTIRDYINVVDLCEAHIKAIDYLTRGGKSEAINLSAGKGTSVLDVIKTVEQYTGVTIPLKTGSPRNGEYSVMTSSYAKAAKLLHWQPKRTMATSIQTLITWYKSRPHGWEY